MSYLVSQGPHGGTFSVLNLQNASLPIPADVWAYVIQRFGPETFEPLDAHTMLRTTVIEWPRN